MRGLEILLIAALLCAQVSAEVMVIHKSDGSTQRIAVDKIKGMTFTHDVAISRTGLTPVKRAILLQGESNKVVISVARKAPVAISLVTVQGRVVEVHGTREYDPGTYTISLADAISKLASGVFFVHATIGNDQYAVKMVRF